MHYFMHSMVISKCCTSTAVRPRKFRSLSIPQERHSGLRLPSLSVKNMSGLLRPISATQWGSGMQTSSPTLPPHSWNDNTTCGTSSKIIYHQTQNHLWKLTEATTFQQNKPIAVLHILFQAVDNLQNNGSCQASLTFISEKFQVR